MGSHLFASDFALSESLHHLRMFDTFTRLQLIAMLLKEVGGNIECCTLIPVYKCVVARNALGIARGKLKRIFSP